MRTLKLTLSYDGSNYAGWQSQTRQRTLQDALEQVLLRITGEAIRVTASGRTDSGVHALGQVVSFRTASQLPAQKFCRALNAWLPRDMAALAVEEAPDNFHAIRWAVRKRYRYTIQDGPILDVFRRHYCWHNFTRLDVDAMHAAAQSLVGKHDFVSFETGGSPRKTSVRTVYELSVRRGIEAEAHLVFTEIEADGFLYNMVRTIVGTLIEVGRGGRPISWPGEVLYACSRRSAGMTAPAHGLTLMKVEYGATDADSLDAPADADADEAWPDTDPREAPSII